MKVLRKWHALSLVALSTVLLGSGGRLRWIETSGPTTLDPRFARTAVDLRTQALIFDQLYAWSERRGELRSRLVDRLEPMGPRQLRLLLRRDVRWHDGERLAGIDVCFTLGLASEAKLPWAVPFLGCDSDGREVLLKLRADVDDPRTLLRFPVLPAHVLVMPGADARFAEAPVGTGPLRLLGHEGDSWHFVAHRSPHLQLPVRAGTLLVTHDPLVAVRTLESGGADGVIEVPPSLLAELRAVKGVTLVPNPLRAWWFVALNTRTSPLSDPHVRAALDVAIDRQELCGLTLGRVEGAAVCTPISGPWLPSQPEYNRGVPVPQLDAQEVVRQMALAGAEKVDGRWQIGGESLVLRLGTSADLDAEARGLLVLLGDQLGRAGFGSELMLLSSEEWSEHALSGALADYDLLVGRWTQPATDDLSAIFHSRGQGRGARNLFNFSDPTIDRLLDTHPDGPDADRERAWELHAALADARPYLFLWTVPSWSAWRAPLGSVVVTPVSYFGDLDSWTYDRRR